MIDQETLIVGLKNKDPKALSELYDRYSGAIYGVIIKMCKDEEKAENLLQDTFLKVWEKGYQFDPEKGRFYTWVYRIARNNVLNSLRKSDDLIQTEDLSVYEDKGDNSEPFQYSKLKGTISKLQLHHQQAIELVYFKGYKHREAHKIMKVPLGTFKSYVRQALKQLKEYYENG